MLLFSHLVGTETLDIGVNKSQTPPEAILPSQQHDTTVLLQAELLNNTKSGSKAVRVFALQTNDCKQHMFVYAHLALVEQKY